MKRVLSLWLPRLPTDRLCRKRPEWRVEPLATSAAEGGALLLRAVNDAAQARGLVPGLRYADARALVPDLRTIPADPGADAALLNRLVLWCERYTPWVGHDGNDGLMLDITGVDHLFGGEAALRDDLVARLNNLGLAARAAIADSPAGAWALARHDEGDGIMKPGMARAALASLPVAGLRLPPADADALERLGLKHIGDLCDLPRAALAARFGPCLCRRLDRALGREAEPISPLRPIPAARVHRDFAEPLSQIADLASILNDLLSDLRARLERTQQGVRRLELALFRSDGKVDRLTIGTARATRDPDHLARLLAEPLSRHTPDAADPATAIDAVTLNATAVESFAADQLVLSNAGRGDEAEEGIPAALIDRLANRLGAGNVMRLTPRASHIPERAAAHRPPLVPSPGAAWRRDRSRPVLLLANPEPVEVVASLPEGPPALVRWRGRVLRIGRAAGPERISAEWWRDAQPTRDYYRAEDFDGRRLWLYRAGLYRADTPPRWFVHGLFP